jgi:hypothetical protein
MGTNADDPLLDEGSAEGQDLDGPLQLRQAYKRLQRDTAEKERAAEQRGLEAGRDQARRELAAEQLATSLGFNAQFGATFLRSNEGADPTEDAMKAFAESMGIPLRAQEAGEPPSPETTKVPDEVVAGATAFLPGETGAQTPGKLFTAQEFMEIYQDPSRRAEADQIAREGRVVLKNNVRGSGTFERPHQG